jgi:glycosyltransferase involved in cell wall biosynthesis
MQRVKESIFSPAVIEDKVIPNGVDLSIFKPGIRSDARGKLNIPQKAKVVLFVADNAKVNMLKDYSTAETASQAVSDRLAGQHLIFICLGSAGTPVKKRNMEIWFVGYQRDPLIVSQYYQAADVCLHSTKVDTFPNAILEAMACGIPVVATAIGGIPEQIEDNKNGFLVPLSGHETMAERVFELLTDQKLVENMSKNAAESAHSKFDVNQQIKQYLDFYADILNNNKGDL